MLQEKIKIRNLTLPSRLVMAPVDLELSDKGQVTEKQLNYYKDRTQSGRVGLVVMEHSFVKANGRAITNQLSIAQDQDVEGLQTLVKAIHDNGSPMVFQLAHAGAAIREQDVAEEGVSPSGLLNPNPIAGGGQPRGSHAMSLEEIEDMKEHFVAAALRAKAAGADGVEIHVAHAYLLNQFYSPLTNKRTDAYGGSLENRLRITTEIIALVREAVGTDMLLGVRLGASDYMVGGNDVAEGARAAQILEAAGIDYISVSGGMCGSRHPENTKAGFFEDSVQGIKNVVTVPVILTGGIKTQEEANQFLSSHTADLIGVARAIVANPNWAAEQVSPN